MFLYHIKGSSARAATHHFYLLGFTFPLLFIYALALKVKMEKAETIITYTIETDHILRCTLNTSTMMDRWSKEDFMSQDSICIAVVAMGKLYLWATFMVLRALVLIPERKRALRLL